MHFTLPIIIVLTPNISLSDQYYNVAELQISITQQFYQGKTMQNYSTNF